MKTLYFDCFSGASGNMILGGLVSLGVEPSFLKTEIAKLGISEFSLDVTKVDRSGISAFLIETVYEEEKQHRHLSDIERIISESGLSDNVKGRSTAIFGRLAKAEAAVHGVEIEKVHFHEVGAMDAIIDVVGACIGFDLLEINRFVCSKIHLGSGFVNTDHGRYPVPPPAVSELLKGVPIYSTEVEGELITPTGAAIIAQLCSEYGELKDFTPGQIGYGAGTREYDNFPNVLRMIMGKTAEKPEDSGETLCLLETNLDDVTGETLGYLMDESISMGALDCWFTPIQMKKNRPANMVSILCRESVKEKLKELLYTETSTIGIRIQTTTRECLEREISSVETRYGVVELKIAKFGGKVVNVKPEFEQMRSLAKSNGIELKRLVQEIAALCAERFEGARIVGSKAVSGSR